MFWCSEYSEYCQHRRRYPASAFILRGCFDSLEYLVLRVLAVLPVQAGRNTEGTGSMISTSWRPNYCCEYTKYLRIFFLQILLTFSPRQWEHLCFSQHVTDGMILLQYSPQARPNMVEVSFVVYIGVFAICTDFVLGRSWGKKTCNNSVETVRPPTQSKGKPTQSIKKSAEDR